MDTLEAVARSLGGLLAVLALVWLLARVLRGRAGGARGPAGLRVTQRAGLGRRSGVAVVEAGSRRILVGVGEAQVTFLADLGDVTDEAEDAGGSARPAGIVVREVAEPGVPAPRGTGLRDLVGRARERTVRR
jgi:flagellar biogenesis protein FliO